MATRNYPGNITALGLRGLNRRSIVSARGFETIKLRKSIVKRCNRYDNGSYRLKDAVCSELYRGKSSNVLIFCEHKVSQIARETSCSQKIKSEDYPLVPFDEVINGYD